MACLRCDPEGEFRGGLKRDKFVPVKRCANLHIWGEVRGGRLIFRLRVVVSQYHISRMVWELKVS